MRFWLHVLRSAAVCLAVVSVFPCSAQMQRPTSFDDAMRLMEEAKHKGDWAEGEKYTRCALRYRFNEYAACGLAWFVGHQGRHEEALALAKEAVDRVGPTALSLGDYAEQALWAGDIGLADKILARAETLGFQNGTDWPNTNIVRFRNEVKEARSAAVYHLRWTIPNRDFPGNGRKRFLFPAMSHLSQTFTFQLEGADRYQIVQLPDWTMVDIWPKPGDDVTVVGTATIQPQVLGVARLAKAAGMPLKPAAATKTGALYYHDERIDPAYQPCVDLAKTLTKGSAAETIQAILDWRAAHITYAVPPAGNTLETILASHKGVCHHSAYLVACLARAAGIPAYVVGGVVLPAAKGSFRDAEGSHGWGEVELPGLGRVAYDSQDKGTLCSFVARKHYLRFGGQDFTVPWSSLPEVKDCISLQGYRVSGERVQ